MSDEASKKFLVKDCGHKLFINVMVTDVGHVFIDQPSFVGQEFGYPPNVITKIFLKDYPSG